MEKVKIYRKKRKGFKDNELIFKGKKIITTVSIDRMIYFKIKALVLKNKKIGKKSSISQFVEKGLYSIISKNYDILAEEYRQKKLELLTLENLMKRENILRQPIIVKDDEE